MVAISELWLPIVVAAVFVFIASSVIHMLLPIHRSDYGKVPKEDELRATLRDAGIQPGEYVIPCAGSMKEMGDPEFVAKMNEGPVLFMNVRPNGPMNMGAQLGQWFGLSILISAIAGYVAGITVPAGADYMLVFRITGTVAFTGYAVSAITDSIWKGISWSITAKYVFDGLVYGLVTAGAFGWLWPGIG